MPDKKPQTSDGNREGLLENAAWRLFLYKKGNIIFTSGLDGRPIEDCDEKDFGTAYVNACIEIANIGIRNHVWSTADGLYAAYPLLKEYAKEFSFA